MNMPAQSSRESASSLKKARSATNHWIAQRLSAALLVLLLGWFVFFLYQASSKDIKTLIYELQNPFNLLCFCGFVLVSLYHGMLGMEVIIQDYVANLKIRCALIWALKIFTAVTLVAFISAVAVLML